MVVTDSAGNGYAVDKEGNVTKSSGSIVASSTSANNGSSVAATKETRLLAEFLERFETQISQSTDPSRHPLFPMGAGPISAHVYEQPLADCMPEDQEQRNVVRFYASKTRADQQKLQALLDKIFQSADDKETITSITNSVNPGTDQKYAAVLTPEQVQKVEDTFCPYVVESAKQEFLELWWNAPYWERAAKILKEHFEDQGLYEDVTVTCSTDQCKTSGIIKIAEGVTATVEVAFSSRDTPDKASAILREHGVDFHDAVSVSLPTFSARFWNWMDQKDDNLYQGKGVESAIVEILADVVMAAPGTIQGWWSGKHWRTGDELAMWEHILGILDVVPAEALAKVGVTALVIKIGGKVIDISKFTAPVKSFIVSSYKAGLKVLIKSADEVILYAADGLQQIGRMVNGVFQDLYFHYGGDKLLARIANVKYMVDSNSGKIIDGSLDFVEGAAKSGVWIVRENWNGFVNIFKGTSDEIATASARIKSHRATTGGGGNYGYLEGTVDGKTVDDKLWRSGAANTKTEPQIFDAIEVEGNSGAWLRNTDSEYKMLNKLASDLGGSKGRSYPSITGGLKIISENPYCLSCQGVIQQFNEMFPNIKLILIDGAK